MPLTKGRRGTAGWMFSIAAFAVPLAIYIATLLPGVGFWDTAEMQTVPYIFGVAHPPGFPTFVIFGYVFSHLFAIGNVAWRISLMSALAMAGAIWFVFRTLEDQDVNPILGCLCAWAFAFGSIVWERGTRAEIHALVLFFIAAAIWSALRFRAGGHVRTLYACALSVGFAAATHPVMIWILPGTVVLLATASRERQPNSQPGAPALRKAAIAIGLAIAPMLLYLYMPARSIIITSEHLDPTRTLGLRSGQPFWDYGHTADPRRFVLQITGAQFPKKAALGAAVQISAYGDFALEFASKAFSELGAVMLAFALIGIGSMFRRDWTKGLGFLLIALAGVPFALRYSVEIDADRYLLTAYWCISVLAGVGAQALLSLIQTRPERGIALSLIAMILFESVVYDFKTNPEIWAQRRDRTAEAFIDRIVDKTPARSVIAAPWTFAAPLAYAAYVERRLDGRVVVETEPAQIDARAASWAATRPVFVVYFETGRRPLTGVRQIPVDLRTPSLYRVVPGSNGKPH